VFVARSKETVTPFVPSQRPVEGELAVETTPLNVPGVFRLLSASATYVGVVAVLLVAMSHETSVGKPAVSQFGSVLGFVAFPTVISSDTVAVS
jgi:hypothetical protein